MAHLVLFLLVYTKTQYFWIAYLFNTKEIIYELITHIMWNQCDELSPTCHYSCAMHKKYITICCCCCCATSFLPAPIIWAELSLFGPNLKLTTPTVYVIISSAIELNKIHSWIEFIGIYFVNTHWAQMTSQFAAKSTYASTLWQVAVWSHSLLAAAIATYGQPKAFVPNAMPLNQNLLTLYRNPTFPSVASPTPTNQTRRSTHITVRAAALLVNKGGWDAAYICTNMYNIRMYIVYVGLGELWASVRQSRRISECVHDDVWCVVWHQKHLAMPHTPIHTCYVFVDNANYCGVYAGCRTDDA